MERLEIWENLSAPDGSPNRFRVVEVYKCIDGCRTRISQNSFSTAIEAQDFIDYLKEQTT